MPSVRPAAVAGMFYPADAIALARDVEAMLAEAQTLLGRLSFGAAHYRLEDVATLPVTARGTVQLPDASGRMHAAMARSRSGRRIVKLPTESASSPAAIDRNAAQAYLDDAGALMNLLLVLMQVSWGLPARSAELTHLRIADAGPGEEPASSSIVFANG